MVPDFSDVCFLFYVCERVCAHIHSLYVSKRKVPTHKNEIRRTGHQRTLLMYSCSRFFFIVIIVVVLSIFIVQYVTYRKH